MYWLDTTILTCLGIGVALGLRSGLLWQISRIVSLSLAVYGAVIFHGPASRLCQDMLVRDADPYLSQALAYGIVFLGVYLACFFLTRMLHRLIKATDLELVDRLLGGMLGALKMTLVVMVICLIATHVDHPATRDVLARSALVPGFTKGLQALMSYVPEEYRTRFGDAFQDVRAKIFQQAALPAPDPADDMEPETTNP